MPKLRVLDHLEDVPSGYEIAEFVGTPAALHVRVAKDLILSRWPAWAHQETM
jgi:hypothetical protein